MLPFIIPDYSAMHFSLQLQLYIRIHLSYKFGVASEIDLNAADYELADDLIEANNGQIHLNYVPQWSLEEPIPILLDKQTLDLMFHSWHLY